MAGSDLSGEVIDRRYRIIDRLSEGAMGVVYRGVRTKLDRPVAIKVMHVALSGAMKGRQRFEREAQLMARLDHPHCVSIIDYGVHRQKPYVVMELVRGQSLHEMITEQGRIEIPRAVEILRQTLSGLAHAHEQGIIHRDIKPANIMITPKAPLGLHVRILDFGLARMLGGSTSLSNGIAVGTPSYMAPEQCRGEELGPTVDIYGCGIVLFEMLTGKKPLTSEDPIATLKKQTDEPPPRLADVAPGDYGALEDIVARALKKAPADRFQSALAMSEALDAALGGRVAPESTAVLPRAGSLAVDSSTLIPITVATTAIVMKRRPSVRPMAPSSRKPFIVVLLLLLLAAAAIAGVTILQRRPAKQAAVARKTAVPHDAAIVAPPPPAVDAAIDPTAEIVESAQQLAAKGKVDAALDMLAKARTTHPDRASLPLLAGKLFFSKFWWNDGLASFRAAIKLDPSLRDDRGLVDTAVAGFLTTPDYDSRLGNFVLELGPAAVPVLEELARTHRFPAMRARAAAIAKRLQAALQAGSAQR